MKSKPITAKASPLKIKEEKSKKTTTSSTSYETDASGNLFKVDRSASAGDVLASAAQPSGGSSVPKAAASGSKTSNPDAYVAGLKKRFPGATGQDLVQAGYISSAYADRFPASQQASSSSSSSTSSMESETKTPVMRPAEPGNEGMTTDTRWNWQQKNINRTQQSQRRSNRKQARADMKYMESQGLVERTGDGGRGQGYRLTEAGSANADAAKRYDLNQADIFGVDQTRFTRDEKGNITGRNESYNPQDSRKNRAQTGTYNPHDVYKEARPEEQWNVNRHGDYGNTTTSSSSSNNRTESSTMSSPSDSRAESSTMFGNAPQEKIELPAKKQSLDISQPNVEIMRQVPTERTYDGGQLDEVDVVSGYSEPDFSEKSILGSEGSSNAFLSGLEQGSTSGLRNESAPISTSGKYQSRGNMEAIDQEETPLQMKYKHNPRMMYKDSPAKMWGDAKTEAGDKGVFNKVKSETASKPITKFSNGGGFKMKGFNK